MTHEACEDEARACDEQADRWEAEIPAHQTAVATARAAAYGSHRHRVAERDLAQMLGGIQHYRAEAVRLRAQVCVVD